MEDSSGETSKIRSKLCLKRNISDSSQTTLSQTVKKDAVNDLDREKNFDNDEATPNENVAHLSSVEDSLADFKSPPDKSSLKPILSKFKADSNKAKKKILKSKNKSNLKVKKVAPDSNQPSIESSFFKPQSSKQNEPEVKESFPCPLCLKPFKDDTSQFNHMKICAAKNNVTIKQLLDAKKLQDRQAEERKAMGLLAAPAIPERKKVYSRKNYSTGDDQHLQLVIAMSESLYEAKQLEELEQAAFLAGIPSECIREMNDEERRITLQSFGFTTNKPIIDETDANRAKKKKSSNPTILQTRSKAEKDRVLTERIACILTGDDALTQARLNKEEVLEKHFPIDIRSEYLKDIERKTNRIWDRSKLTKKLNKFYVEKLELYLLTSKRKDSSNILDDTNNDEQIIDLFNESIKYEPVEFHVPVVETDKKKVESPHHNNFLENTDNKEQNVSSLDHSKNYEPMEIDIPVIQTEDDLNSDQQQIQSQNCSNLLKNTNNNEQDVILSDQAINYETEEFNFPLNQEQEKENFNFLNSPESDKMNCELDFMKKTISNWGEALNDSLSSDMVIFVKNKKFIYAHRLVFRVQCFKILSDIKPYNTNIHPQIKGQISWLDNDELPVLAFLEFIYCGVININIGIFDNNSQLSQLKNLAKLYRVKRLSQYLKLKQNELKRPNNFGTNDLDGNHTDQGVASESLRESNNSPKAKKSLSFEFQPLKVNPTETLPDTNTIKKDTAEKNLKSRRTMVSPDLFESESEDGSVRKNKNQKIEEKSDDESLDCRLNLVYESSKTNTDNPDYSDSDQTVINLSNTNLENADVASKEMQNDVEEMSQIGTQPCIVDKSFDSNYELHAKANHSAKTPPPNTSEKENLVYLSIESKNSDHEDISTEDLIHDAITPPKSELTIDDVHTAVTPPPIIKEDDRDKELPEPRIRISEIDKLLEKARKENAKSLMDTDSEIDSPLVMLKRDRFLKRNKHDSYSYLLKDDSKKNQRRVISLLEDDILAEEKLVKKKCEAVSKENDIDDLFRDEFPNIYSCPDLKDDQGKSISKTSDHSDVVYNTESISVKSPRHESSQSNPKIQNTSKESSFSNSDDDNEAETINESGDISRYSKYKRQNKNHNSIDKYRSKFHFDSNQSSSDKSTDISPEGDSQNLLKKSVKNIFKTSAESKNINKDITLVSDSDDEQNLSLPETSKNVEDQENDTAKKSLENDDASFEELLKKLANSPHANSSETNIKDSEINSNVSNNRKKKRKTKKFTDSKSSKSQDDEIINLSSDSDEGNVKFDRLSHHSGLKSTHSSQNKHTSNSKDKSRSLNSKKNSKNQTLESTEKIYEDVHDEISRILETSPKFDDEDFELSEKSNKTVNQNNFPKDKKENTQEKDEVIILSPISIISSPESGNKNDKSTKMDISNERNDFAIDPIDNDYFNDIEIDTGWITSPSKIPKVGSTKKTSPKLGSPSIKKPSTSKNSFVSSLISSPILSQNKKPPRAKPSKSTSNKSNKEEVSGNCRKLKTKSASAMNIIEKSKESGVKTIQKSASFTTPERNKKHKESETTAYLSDLDTPNLHKELRKFGVKPQPRPKAKKLLRHIYNEIPSIAINSQKRGCEENTSSEDEDKPPLKKPNVNRNFSEDNDEPLAENSDNCEVIAEEMDYDSDNNESENSKSLKDAFYKLLDTDRELHTKIVIYEPLPLESIHSRLKQNGFKCKINALMDFLDQQCITFQAQNNKGSRTKKKKK